LVDAVRSDRVTVKATRIAGTGTGRIAVLLRRDGERTFVTQRGAAQLLRPADIKRDWFRDLQLLHVPVYSLLGDPLSAATHQAIEFAKAAGSMVSIDLASIGPLMADGPRVAEKLVGNVAADLLFATAAEAAALTSGGPIERLLDFAGIVVVKRGSEGATVLAREGLERLRFEVATAPLPVADSTGAGDAFDAGFIVGWFAARSLGRSLPASLHRAAVAGNRAAGRQLQTPRPELALR
jgi:sugar/nucleoside kinase (ribokinase family)